MITIRYPTGHVVTYNEANYVTHDDIKFHLKKTEGGATVAIIPYSSGATVEFFHPSNIKTEFNTLDDALVYVSNNIDRASANMWSEKGKALKKIKSLLRSFDCRNGNWK